MSDTAASSALQSLSATLSGLVAEAAPSLVAVHSHRSRASGFAWRPGLIVTADEALADEGDIAVTLFGGERKPASVVGRDPSTDIALLRVECEPIRPVAFAEGLAEAGVLALTVGARDGMPLAALGVVSYAGPGWRSLRGGEIAARIELDVALRREAEGGVVLDDAGRALGMAVFGPRRRALVIPAATIERVAGKLEAHGRIPRGYLGLGLQEVRLDGGGVGAMVMSVDRDGPGAAAGVLQGDVVTAWDGKPVTSVRRLVRELGPDSVGTAVALALTRAGAAVEVRLTIGERPNR